MEDKRHYYYLVAIICLQGAFKVTSAPNGNRFCAEETKNRHLIGAEPYAKPTTAKSPEQCVAQCISDVRQGKALCKSVVYGRYEKICAKYNVRADDRGVQLVRVDEAEMVAYYEVMTKCPEKHLMDTLDARRRDAGDSSDRSESRPFAERLLEADSGPPGFAPLPGYSVAPSAGFHGGAANALPQASPQNQQPADYGSGPAGPPPQPTGYGGVPVGPPPAPAPSQYGRGQMPVAPPPAGQPCCGQTIVIKTQPCCPQPQPQPQPCCPAPQPQPCCPAPQPQPCCPAPQPQPSCCPAPQPQPCCTQPPPPPEWGPWSEWSACQQVPCAAGGGGGGGSVQTRTRTCQGAAYGGGGCQGEGQQSQNCGCLQGQWTQWSPPSACSSTCGSGTQSRTRTCTVPGTCPGSGSDQSPCDMGPCCHWTEWSPAEQCPVTCGQGSTVRRRKCVDMGSGQPTTGCQGPDSEPQPCGNLPPCCSNWTPWSSCTATCGSGVQTRQKTCDGGVGSSTEQQPCPSMHPCCSAWSNWSPCQAVCGQGSQTRTRSCGSGGYVSGGGGAGMGVPTLPNSGGGCCGTTQQQSCSTGGCSQNTFYGQGAQLPPAQSYPGYYNKAKKARRKRSIFNKDDDPREITQ